MMIADADFFSASAKLLVAVSLLLALRRQRSYECSGRGLRSAPGPPAPAAG